MSLVIFFPGVDSCRSGKCRIIVSLFHGIKSCRHDSTQEGSIRRIKIKIPFYPPPSSFPLPHPHPLPLPLPFRLQKGGRAVSSVKPPSVLSNLEINLTSGIGYIRYNKKDVLLESNRPVVSGVNTNSVSAVYAFVSPIFSQVCITRKTQ